MEAESKISFTYLRKFNLGMGVLHAFQGIIMIIIGSNLEFSREVYTFYLKFETENGSQDNFNIFPNVEKFFTFDFVGIWVASFLLLSSIAHFLIAGPLYDFYVKNLEKQFNPIRWIEYALSSSVMIVFIALLFGVWDFWSLFLIFMVNGLMNLFGYSMELQNQSTEKVDWTNYIFGWIAGATPWIVITSYFINIQSVGGEVPWFVYWIFAVEVILFNCFAFNMFLQYKRVGPWKDYLYGERMYQILSLVAKTLLAWLVFAGVFQPE
ncbi:MAG: heliorhodopsin HeR [Candidatus Kariarchaeaceae archaeon]|jgi:hypothetical protein